MHCARGTVSVCPERWGHPQCASVFLNHTAKPALAAASKDSLIIQQTCCALVTEPQNTPCAVVGLGVTNSREVPGTAQGFATLPGSRLGSLKPAQCSHQADRRKRVSLGHSALGSGSVVLSGQNSDVTGGHRGQQAISPSLVCLFSLCLCPLPSLSATYQVFPLSLSQGDKTSTHLFTATFQAKLPSWVNCQPTPKPLRGGRLQAPGPGHPLPP